MRLTPRLAPALLLVLVVSPTAYAVELPSFDASFDLPPAAPPARPRLATDLGLVASTDDRTGLPTFLWGGLSPAPTSATGSASDAALAHVRARAGTYGLTDAALATVSVAHVHDTGRGGILVVLRQELDGVPVVGSDAKVLLRRDLSLVAISGALRGDAVEGPAATFPLPHAGAVARALSDLYATTIPSSVLAPSSDATRGGYRRFDAASTVLRFDQPARARRVHFPMGRSLVPAYYAEVFSSLDGASWDAYAYVIDAHTGAVLQRRNLTAHAAFSYRVFADASGDLRPLDGPIADFTPHPTGVPDESYPAFIAPTLVTIDGFNQFADPWLPAGATETVGNNVDAYTDHDSNNGLSPGDTRGTLTGPAEFGHVYDPSLSPLASAEQQMGSVTQLFYTTNWLHDYWYDSGFDEASGNAQFDNYGRGGDGFDPLRCEAQDSVDDGAANNANMATPADGASPRMQIYLWSGPETRSLTVDVIAQPLTSNVAGFGPSSFDVTSTILLADDGVSTTTDACEPVVNDLTGQIALIDRGNCTFESKVLAAEAAGAVGVLIANNQGGNPPFMPGSASPTIPVMSITQSDGATIKTALLGGPVTTTMYRLAGAQADAALDNLIVAHEWGHYLHHRLVDCGLNQCGGESEGWGDFLALTLALRPGDDLGGVFSAAVYGTIRDPDAAYFGTRRMPYTVDLTKNPLTFQHIQASATLPVGPPMSPGVPVNQEVHNTGEIWGSMLFEGYVAMLQQSQLPSPPYSFDEARRRMTDYVVAGMKLAPVEPTFTEQRDAIIAAAYAADPNDALLIAEGFAKRGAGSCAESPPRDAFDNEGVVESFVVAPAVAVTSLSLDDAPITCDDDGVLDPGELGTITVSIANHGYLAAPGTTITVSSPTPGVSFPSGAVADVANLDGFATEDVAFEVEIVGVPEATVIELVATVENPASCNPTVVRSVAPRTNFDTALASSNTDDLESPIDLWIPEGAASQLIWAREEEASGNHLWHGVDYASLSDTALVSPELTVSADQPLVLSFLHRYKFEASLLDPNDPGSLVTWDGSVIELSTDGGTTWEDASTWVDPGYTGQIANLAENPLSDRMGYVGESADWPTLQPVTLDFGTALAGETVTFRFRIGSDQAASEIGWELDDFSFGGIVGTPFPTIVADAQACEEPPVEMPETPPEEEPTEPEGPVDPAALLAGGGCQCLAAGSEPGQRGSVLAATLVALALRLRRRAARGVGR